MGDDELRYAPSELNRAYFEWERFKLLDLEAEPGTLDRDTRKLQGKIVAYTYLELRGEAVMDEAPDDLVAEIQVALVGDDESLAPLAGIYREFFMQAVVDVLVHGFPGGLRVAPTRSAAGDPVLLHTGELVHPALDVRIAGAGIDFEMTRSYAHQSAVKTGAFGKGWTHAYAAHLRVDGSVAFLSDGHQLRTFRRHPRFGEPGMSYYAPNAGYHGVLEPLGDPGAPRAYRIRGPGDGVRLFEPRDDPARGYRLASIGDRFGNELRFLYSSGDVLARVEVNSVDRYVDVAHDGERRIAALRDHTGRTWTYSYDHHGRLVCLRMPETPDQPRGSCTQYEYLDSLDPRTRDNLVAIVDGDGRRYLDVTYGEEAGSLSYNRVVRQRYARGELLYDYQPLASVGPDDLRPHERPSVAVQVTQPNGHTWRGIVSELGALLAREECIFQGGEVRRLVHRWQYNADGAVVAHRTPEGVVSQHLFGRDQFEHRHGQVPDHLPHPDATADDRRGFGRLLATVERGAYASHALFDLETGPWRGVFPDVRAVEARDVIRKWSYEPRYGQLTTQSDPRFTSSPDPDAIETPEHTTHLTRYEYEGPPDDPTFHLRRIVHPTPTDVDGVSLGPVVEEYLEYDARGRVLRQRDAHGTEVARRYVPLLAGPREGFLERAVADAGGLEVVTSYEVDDLGRTIAITLPRDAEDPGELIQTRAYDSRDRVIEERAPLGSERRLSYDGAGNLVRTETAWTGPDRVPLGDGARVWEACYDEEARVVATRIGSERSGFLETLICRGPSGEAVAVTLPGGNRIERAYDELGREIAVTAGAGTAVAATTRARHDRDGRVTGTRTAEGHGTELELDPLGRAVAVTDAAGHVVRTRFDALGNPIVRRWLGLRADGQSELLARAEYEYDELGRLRREGHNLFVDPPVATDLESDFVDAGPGRVLWTEYIRDALGRVETQWLPDGSVINASYDALGRQTRLTDPLGNRIETVHDAHGNPVRWDRIELVHDEDGTVLGQKAHSWSGAYDARDRLEASTDEMGNVTAFAYDSLDQLASATDPLGNRTRYEHDVHGRPVATVVERREGGTGEGASLPPAVTRVEYDRNGNPVTYVDPLERRTRTRFDRLDRPFEQVYPDGSTRSLAYDRDSNVIAVREANGCIRRARFDPRGLLVHRSLDTSELDPGIAIIDDGDIHIAYDGLGRVRAARNDVADAAFTVDSLGRALSESLELSIPGPARYEIRHAYDDLGRVSRIEWPGGRSIEIERDALGRSRRVRNLANGSGYPGDPAAPDDRELLRMTYAGVAPAATVRPSGARTEWIFDAGERLVEKKHAIAAGDETTRQLHDAVGNVRLRTEAVSVHRYDYDSEGQLVRAAGATGDPAIDPAPLLPPDAPMHPIPHRQPDADRQWQPVVATTEREWELDLAGNREAVSTPAETTDYDVNDLDQYVDVDGRAFTHDRSGNVVGDETWSYQYDGQHRLAAVREADTGRLATRLHRDALGRIVAEQRETATTHLIHSGSLLIEERDPASGRSVQYVPSDSGQAPLHIATQGTDAWPHCDVMGSVVLLTDASGSPLSRYRYDEYGERDVVEESIAVAFGFIGARSDPSTGLVALGPRHYAPGLGRFLQRDPIGRAGGPNLYAYAGNNPLAFVDTSGLARTEYKDRAPSSWLLWAAAPGAMSVRKSLLDAGLQESADILAISDTDIAENFGAFWKGVGETIAAPVLHPVETAEGIRDGAVATYEFARKDLQDELTLAFGDDDERSAVLAKRRARLDNLVESAERTLLTSDPSELSRGAGSIAGGFVAPQAYMGALRLGGRGLLGARNLAFSRGQSSNVFVGDTGLFADRISAWQKPVRDIIVGDSRNHILVPRLVLDEMNLRRLLSFGVEGKSARSQLWRLATARARITVVADASLPSEASSLTGARRFSEGDLTVLLTARSQSVGVVTANVKLPRQVSSHAGRSSLVGSVPIAVLGVDIVMGNARWFVLR